MVFIPDGGLPELSTYPHVLAPRLLKTLKEIFTTSTSAPGVPKGTTGGLKLNL